MVKKNGSGQEVIPKVNIYTMYILIFEIIPGLTYVDRSIYTFDNLDYLYQFVENEVENWLGIELDEYWDVDIFDIFDNRGGFWIYGLDVQKSKQDLIFESRDKTWGDFYRLCLGKNENLVLDFSRFLESKKNKFSDIKTVTVDDFVVLIGKNAESNDYLSFQVATADDLWFHVKGLPGSHVVLKIKENLPMPETIEKVAKLAAKNSRATGTCAVVYCKAKFLSKTSDMKPGQVSVDYTNSELVEITV